MSDRLVLFDIDMTLVSTGGLGVRAMREAGRDLFARDLDDEGVHTAGRLDPLIMIDMLRLAGVDPSRPTIDAWRRAYARRLGALVEEAAANGGGVQALPGALALIDHLEHAHEGALTLGLLTGNFQETGTIKLTAAGFRMDPFRVRVWGDESPHDPPARDHLPALGLQRHADLLGRPPDPSRVTIIGDTIHDIACARAHDCRSIGVTTGGHDRPTLEQAGANLVVDSLEDAEALAAWIMQ